MREMKNSGVEWIGEIPANWEVKKFKHVADIYTGNSIKDEEKSMYEDPNEAVPYIATKDIKSVFNTVDYGNGIYIKNDDLSFVRAYSGDTLMCIEGGSAGKKKARIDRTVCFVNKLCCFHATAINSDFLYYILNSPNYEEEFMFNITGLIGGVSKNKLMNFVLPFPSLPEQHRIADFLDEKCAKIDAVIEKQKQVIEKLKEYKLSIITEAVTKGLDPTVPMKDSGVKWIGEIPCDAEVVSVSKIFKIVLGKMLSTKAVEDNETLEKYFCAANVHFDTIDYDNLKQMWFSDYEKNIYKVKKGDLLVVEGGAGAGGANVVSLDVEDCYIQNSIMIVRPLSYIRSKWLYYYLYSLVKRNYIDYVCNKATIPHFTKDKLSKTKIVVFSENETEIILKKLDETVFKVDETITQKQSIIDKLTEYKKSLIYEVVTGKKEV